MLVVDSAVKLVENTPEEEGEPQKGRELREGESALCDCSSRGSWREKWIEMGLEVMKGGVAVEEGEGAERVYCKRGSVSVAVDDVGEDEGEGFER